MRLAVAARARGRALALLAAAVLCPDSSAGAPGRAEPARREATLLEGFARMPLRFEANRGQADPAVRFLARSAGASVFLTPTEAVFVLTAPGPAAEQPLPRSSSPARFERAALRMTILGANPAAAVAGEQELPGSSNYFLGGDRARWRTGVPSYARIRYADVYTGIDLVYHGEKGRLEYDFVVKPGADPGQIRLSFAGADRLELDGNGDLVLHSPAGRLRQRKPALYQDVEGVRRPVAGSYRLAGPRDVAFQVSDFDRTEPLVIDPVLVFSTYLGGSGIDYGAGIAVDASGHVYVTGFTGSADFPATAGALDTSFNGSFDIYVAKLDPTGTALVYSTYIGGGGTDAANAVAVDAAGNAYVAGYTTGAPFPTTPGAFDTTANGGQDVVVFKLDPAGSALVYSTYLGGSGTDGVQHGIAIDGAGAAYVAGTTQSADFPTTPGAFDTSFNGGFFGTFGDIFVTKVNPAGSGLAYSTFLGGSGPDGGRGIAVDGTGSAYVTGITGSADFPTSPGAIDASFNGGSPSNPFDPFVAKLDPAGASLVYSTYLGGSGFDDAFLIAVDAAGQAHVAGRTGSPDLPTTPGAFDTSYNGDEVDAYVAKLNAFGSVLLYSTFLGGSGNDEGFGIALDGDGNAYLNGSTGSADFPTTADAFDTSFNGAFDTWVAQLDATGASLLYSTYLGGSGSEESGSLALAAGGNVYVTGNTLSADFPTTAGALDTTYNGSRDGFVARFEFLAPDGCPDDPAKTEPGACGCGVPDSDGDGDGIFDCLDSCPADPENDADGDGVCGDADNCPAAANPDQADADGDGLGDACDACPADAANDADGDGVCGDVDNCPTTPNPDQADAEGDGVGDACTPPLPLLDDFNRPGPGLGANWSGTKSSYRIEDQYVHIYGNGPIYWRPASFGADQEVSVTLTEVDPAGVEHDLLLKVQAGTGPNYRRGVIEVVYDGRLRKVRVDTLLPGASSSWTQYAAVPLTLVNGDRFGGRATAGGRVFVYKNGALVATFTLNAADQAFFNPRGGYTGLWFDYANQAHFDDFAGGSR